MLLFTEIATQFVISILSYGAIIAFLASSQQTLHSRTLTYLLPMLLQSLHFIGRFNVISLSIIRTKQLTQGHREYFTFLSFYFLVGELNIQCYNGTPNPQDDAHLFAIAKLYSTQI